MASRVEILPEALQDAREAYRWYEEQRTGLGDRFLRALEARIASIRQHPELCAVAFKDYRRALLRRFPYAVYYKCEPEVVTIYSVFHCAQDPEKWRSRLS